MTTLERLARWYESNCNGTWEHGHGVRLTTVDNPGWHVEINVKDTPLGDSPFVTREDEYTHEREWLRCWKEGATFQIACGPGRLEDGLKIFLDWAEESSE